MHEEVRRGKINKVILTLFHLLSRLKVANEAVPREGNSVYSRMGKRAGAVVPGRVLVSAHLACRES